MSVQFGLFLSLCTRLCTVTLHKARQLDVHSVNSDWLTLACLTSSMFGFLRPRLAPTWTIHCRRFWQLVQYS